MNVRGQRAAVASGALQPLAYRRPVFAQMSGISEEKIRRLVAEGRLEAVEVDGQSLILARSARRLLGLEPDES
ncbi:MAG TPA: hypothetical protein VIQ53_26725 [Inquilinus sp.]